VSAERPIKKRDVTENQAFAALCYMAFLCLVPLFSSRQDKFIRFHARQGLIVLISFIIAVVIAIYVPLLGNLLFFLTLVGNAIALGGALIGYRWKIPILGMIADKLPSYV
jgi:fumarate reductase subunit D